MAGITKILPGRFLEVACDAEGMAEVDVCVSKGVCKALSAILGLIAGTGFTVRGTELAFQAV